MKLTPIFVVMLALACGRATAPAGVTSVAEGSPRPEEFCAEWARASCASDVRCMPATVASDVAECVPRATAQCQRERVVLTPRTLSAISAGRIEWRFAEAAACLKLLDGPCANRELQKKPQFGYPDVTVADPCRPSRLWAGKTAPGAACEHPLECAAGTCNACGRCPSTTPAGGSCPAAPCVPGTVCLLQTRTCDVPPANCTIGGDCATVCGEMIAFSGFSDCVSPAPVGGACEYSVVRDNTSVSSTLKTPCLPGLACTQNGCTSPAVGGQPCYRIRECAVGLTCLSSGGCGQFRNEGEPCAPPLRESDRTIHVNASTDRVVWTGEGGECGLGLACIDGACRRRPQVGESCVQAPGDPVRNAPCFGVAGVVCDAARCVVPAAGNACATDNACLPGEWCACGTEAATAPCRDGAVGACRPGESRPTGAACEHDRQCASGACWQGHCAEHILGVGASCTTDVACGSGACGVETRRCLPACG